MFSSDSPVSNENQVPEIQPVRQKSVGRSQLRVLGVLDPNSLDNQRLSLPKPAIGAVLLGKETSYVCAGYPIGAKVGSSNGDDYTEGSTRESTFLDSKNSQSNPTDFIPDFSCQTQNAFNENKAIKCFNVGRNTMASVLTERVDNEHADSKTECKESTLKVDSLGEVQSDMLNQNVESLLSDAAHHVTEAETVMKYTKLTTEEACPQYQDKTEAIVGSATSTIVMSSVTSEPEPSPLLMVSGELSFLISKFEDCGISERGEEGRFHGVSTIDDDSLECYQPTERLPPPLPDTMNADKTGHIAEVSSSSFWDSAVVLDKPDSIISHVLLGDECSLPLEASQQACNLTVNEESLCKIKNGPDNDLDLQESTNKCFTPIGGSTPCSEKGESIKKQESVQLSPATQLCHFNLESDPQRNVESDALPMYCYPTPVITSQSSGTEGLSLGRCIGNKITPRVLASFHDFGTSMTPVSASDDFTWMTPIMLLNKSMNTSWNLKGKGEKSARDNTSETDSLLWNFSKEAFCNASREELVDRLEGTLIVVEALSKQLQGWQQQVVSSKPSEQRDCSTQTCVTYSNEAERYYHNCYLKTLSIQQSLQCGLEEEKQLSQMLKEVTGMLSLYQSEAVAMADFAENPYDMLQKDRAVLNQKVGCTQTLLNDYMTCMSKVRCKMKDNLLEREEMKTQMKTALLAKEAADQCLKDLQSHSSYVISQLCRDLETERQLCDDIRDLYQQQHSYNEELVEFVHKAHSVFHEVEDDRIQLRTQCSQAKELMCRHWDLFNIMKEKTQAALEEYEGIKNERDEAVLENQQMCNYLKELTSENKKMELENCRLGSELESLMKTVCSLEADVEQWRLENAELSDKLSAKDLSSRLLEKELNEATARGHDYHDHMKYLSTDVVPSLELELSKASSQNEALQAQLQALKKEHASQIASYKESLEFLEQENEVCREQVKETESQLKTHHLNLLERNYQCEILKDTIKELEKERVELKQKLADAENEAQNTKSEMDKGMSDASTEVLQIKGRLLDVLNSLKESSQREVKIDSYGEQTQGGSFSHSSTFMEESLHTTDLNATDARKVEGIWSDKSAFMIVQPSAPPFAGNPAIDLADLLHDLGRIVSEVVTASSCALDTKQHIIRDLKMDISSLKEALQSQRFQHKSDVRDMQEEVEKLKRRICVHDEKLLSKEKYIKGLQELVEQHEKKILQQLAKVTENEDLIQENAKLKLSVKVYENQVEVLKVELSQNSTDSARKWLQEKLMLQNDLIMMNMKLSDTEYSKAEVVQKLLKHKDILTANLARSEAEVRKLDDIIERIREALHSVPDVVMQCDVLKRLTEFLN